MNPAKTYEVSALDRKKLLQAIIKEAKMKENSEKKEEDEDSCVNSGTRRVNLIRTGTGASSRW